MKGYEARRDIGRDLGVPCQHPAKRSNALKFVKFGNSRGITSELRQLYRRVESWFRSQQPDVEEPADRAGAGSCIWGFEDRNCYPNWFGILVWVLLGQEAAVGDVTGHVRTLYPSDSNNNIAVAASD